MKPLLRSCLLAVGLMLAHPAQSAMRCPGPDCPAGNPDDDRNAKKAEKPDRSREQAKPRPERNDRERQQEKGR